jgi:uncharacterized protein (TIGR00725 family)
MISNWRGKDSIAVLGGATRYTDAEIISAFQIGCEIARQGKHLVTGATTGIPYAAAIGAKLNGAIVVGISPGESLEDHVVRYQKPLDCIDVMICTGMGLEGRNPINLRSATGAIFVGGELGTLNEFCTGWTIGGKVLGILEGTRGISGYIRDILEKTESDYGSVVVYESEPLELVRAVCRQLDGRSFTSGLSHDQIGSDVRGIIKEYMDGKGRRNVQTGG